MALPDRLRAGKLEIAGILGSNLLQIHPQIRAVAHTCLHAPPHTLL